MTNTTAIETLTAEVRVLQVGSRQVTMSVAKQLDEVRPNELEAFGRINLGWDDGIEVIGRSIKTGALVRSGMTCDNYASHADVERYKELHALPLIVLAGLR